MYFTKSEIQKTKVRDYVQKDGRHFVSLDVNPFYEDGFGGQIGDRGLIEDARVLNVSDLVEIDKPLEKGAEVKIFIDLERRKEIARQHSAQHILSAAIEKLYNAKTVGFHMGEEDSTVDIDGDFDLQKSENLSNEIVLSNLKVEEIIVSVDEASKFDLRKDLSEKAIKSGNIRLIKMGDFDLNACGGFHVSNTGEIGFIKIVHTEKIKGSLTRVWFVGGLRAFKDYSLKSQAINESAKLFDASWVDLKSRIQKCIDESKEKNSALKKSSEKLAIYISKEVYPASVMDLEEYVASFVTRARQDIPYMVRISGTNNFILCLPGFDRAKVTEFAKMTGAKGGGNGPVYRFSTDKPDEFMNEFRKIFSHP